MKSLLLVIFLLYLTSDKPWLFLDTDNSQHKVWVRNFTLPDVSLFLNQIMPNDAICGKEVVSKFSRHLPSMEKHYDVFKVPRIYIDAYSSYHTVYLFLVDPKHPWCVQVPGQQWISCVWHYKQDCDGSNSHRINHNSSHSFLCSCVWPSSTQLFHYGSFPKPTITWYVNTVAIVSPEAQLLFGFNQIFD